MAEKQLTSALREFDEKYYGNSLPADTVQNFGLLLDRYIKDLSSARDAGESEEHCKKIINTFLEQSFYGEKDFKVNTFNRIDSSISHHDELRALIEVKRVDSKTEMVSGENLNKKALWELVLYYLTETRNTTGKHVTRKSNVEIHRLIATDGLKWVLIDANDFEKLCDGELERFFFKYRNRQLCKTTIEEVVIRKVNSVLSWDCHGLLEIKERAASIQIAQQVNQAINSIKICDETVA